MDISPYARYPETAVPRLKVNLLRLLASTSSTRRGGQHKLSIKLLASMVEAGLTPDAVTIGELISSLSDRGRWDDAQRVVEIAEKTGAIPASSLDSDFEVDVSRLPPAIAKVKVRDLGGPAGYWCENTRCMCTGLVSVAKNRGSRVIYFSVGSIVS